MTMTTVDKRFWAKIDRGGGCWLWTGTKNGQGYGSFTSAGRTVYAHRYAYTTLIGPIPDGLQLDHLCRTPSCVNPAHLQPVTSAENTLRGVGVTAQNARKTHCKRGHPFDEANTSVIAPQHGRICRACKAQEAAKRRRAALSPEQIASIAVRCANPACRHAPSMHNSLGYCRSGTTPDRSGQCVCEFYERPRADEIANADG